MENLPQTYKSLQSFLYGRSIEGCFEKNAPCTKWAALWKLPHTQCSFVTNVTTSHSNVVEGQRKVCWLTYMLAIQTPRNFIWKAANNPSNKKWESTAVPRIVEYANTFLFILIPHFVPKTSSLATVNCAIYDMHHSKCPLPRVTALLEKVVVNCFVIKRLAVNNVNTKCFVSCIWSVETKGF